MLQEHINYRMVVLFYRGLLFKQLITNPYLFMVMVNKKEHLRG